MIHRSQKPSARTGGLGGRIRPAGGVPHSPYAFNRIPPLCGFVKALFVTQRLYGVHLGGLARRVVTEEHTDEHGEANRQADGRRAGLCRIAQQPCACRTQAHAQRHTQCAAHEPRLAFGTDTTFLLAAPNGASAKDLQVYQLVNGTFTPVGEHVDKGGSNATLTVFGDRLFTSYRMDGKAMIRFTAPDVIDSLLSISVTQPSLTSYHQGDEVSTQGLRAFANYASGPRELSSKEYTLTGTRQATVTYQGMSASFSFTVFEKSAPTVTPSPVPTAQPTAVPTAQPSATPSPSSEPATANSSSSGGLLQSKPALVLAGLVGVCGCGAVGL